MAETDLSRRLRQAIERKRWTQQDLRDALAKLNPEKPAPSLRAIGSWVRGDTEPRNIHALELVLDTSLEEDVDPALQDLLDLYSRLRKNSLTEGIDLSPLEDRINEAKRRSRARGRADLAS